MMLQEKKLMASQELVDTLFRHNFLEVTQSSDPKHWERLTTFGMYMPGSIKRYFKKSGLYLNFDYINIKYQLGRTGSYIKDHITEQGFKSILFYCSLKSSDRQYFNGKNITPSGIKGYLDSREPEFMWTNERVKYLALRKMYDEFVV